jgi:hypothetical protein
MLFLPPFALHGVKWAARQVEKKAADTAHQRPFIWFAFSRLTQQLAAQCCR